MMKFVIIIAVLLRIHASAYALFFDYDVYHLEVHFPDNSVTTFHVQNLITSQRDVRHQTKN